MEPMIVLKSRTKARQSDAFAFVASGKCFYLGISVRGCLRDAGFTCPSNRVGSRIFATANPGQIFVETTIKLLLTDYKI
jgi:hypothetical protein